jgi:hypothetical protein
MSINKKSVLLPFQVIEAAVSGDTDAINIVLKHYECYITALSAKRLYDEDGRSYMCVDEYTRRRLETKLITNLLTKFTVE